MWLLLIETVAAVDAKKMLLEAEPFNEMLAESHRFVGQHRHFHAGRAQLVQAFAHAWIERSRIEHVIAIVLEKVAQAALDLFLIAARQSAPHERGRSITDVGVYGFIGQV